MITEYRSIEEFSRDFCDYYTIENREVFKCLRDALQQIVDKLNDDYNDSGYYPDNISIVLRVIDDRYFKLFWQFNLGRISTKEISQLHCERELIKTLK